MTVGNLTEEQLDEKLYNEFLYSSKLDSQIGSACESIVSDMVPNEVSAAIENSSTIGQIKEDIETLKSSGDGNNYAKLDSANKFTSTEDVNSTCEVSATAVKLNYLSSGMIPFALTIDADKITKQDSGMIAEYTFDTSAGGVLATQEWVTANAGGGSSSSSVTYTDGDKTVTVDPSQSDVVHFVGGLGGNDTSYGMKFESAMRYSDTTTYGMGGITIDRFQDYGGQIKHTTKITFPASSESLPASPTTTTLTLPTTSGVLATQEWVNANAATAQVQIITWEDND
jgi:hypothetical protein